MTSVVSITACNASVNDPSKAKHTGSHAFCATDQVTGLTDDCEQRDIQHQCRAVAAMCKTCLFSVSLSLSQSKHSRAIHACMPVDGQTAQTKVACSITIDYSHSCTTLSSNKHVLGESYRPELGEASTSTCTLTLTASFVPASPHVVHGLQSKPHLASNACWAAGCCTALQTRHKLLHLVCQHHIIQLALLYVLTAVLIHSRHHPQLQLMRGLRLHEGAVLPLPDVLQVLGLAQLQGRCNVLLAKLPQLVKPVLFALLLRAVQLLVELGVDPAGYTTF